MKKSVSSEDEIQWPSSSSASKSGSFYVHMYIFNSYVIMILFFVCPSPLNFKLFGGTNQKPENSLIPYFNIMKCYIAIII